MFFKIGSICKNHTLAIQEAVKFSSEDYFHLKFFRGCLLITIVKRIKYAIVIC